jgi:hypothetical protein
MYLTLKNKNKRSVLLKAAFLFVVCFAFSVMIIHFIHPEVNFIQYPVSYYLTLKWGAILRMGILCFGLAEFLISAYLGRGNKSAALFLLLAGIGAVIIFLFPQSEIETSSIVTVFIHNYAAAAQFLFFPIAVFCIAQREPHVTLKKYFLLTAMLTFLLFVGILILLHDRQGTFLPYYGLVQRIDILLMVIQPAVFTYYKLQVEASERVV